VVVLSKEISGAVRGGDGARLDPEKVKKSSARRRS